MLFRICQVLLFVLFLSSLSLFGGQRAVIVNIQIDGPDEHTLVIPPDYPEYQQEFTCTVNWRVEGTPDEEKEEEEADFRLSYEWSVSGCEIVGSNTAENLTVKYRVQDDVDAFVSCTVSIQSANNFGEGTDGSQLKTVFMPVWDSWTTLQSQLATSHIDGNTTRVVAPGQLIEFNAILPRLDEEDKRESATVTYPLDGVVFSDSTGGMRSIGRGSPYWTATEGLFPNGNMGTNVYYQAPDDAGVFTIRSFLDDYGVKPENESGSRDDAPMTLPDEVTVVVPDLALDGNDAIVRLNRDDDNSDAQEDRLATTASTSDDDILQCFEMCSEPDDFNQGTFKLNATGGNHIRIWRCGTGEPFTRVTLPSTWSASEFFSLPSRELHIEGIQTSSSARDVLLQYSFLAPEATESERIVKSKYITVVDLCLGIDANHDGTVNLADEPIKATTGRYVLVNDDNDNGDNQADKEESTCDSREDDLVPISLVFMPADVSTVTLSAVSGGSCIKLWNSSTQNSSTKDTEVTLPTTFNNTNNPLPAKLYIEGIAEGDCVLRLSCDASPDIKDEIKLRVVKCNLAFDANRDGTINVGEYGQNQDGDPNKPFLFWINDDYDVTTWDEKDKVFVQDDIESTQQDCNDDRIGHGSSGRNECERDLEDFSILGIELSDCLLEDKNISIGFKTEASNGPSISLFSFKDTNSNNGLFDYIKKVAIAYQQTRAEQIATVSNSLSVLDKESFVQYKDFYPFLFEGVAEGTGSLCIILRYNGQTIGERKINIELHSISWFYDYYKTVLSQNSGDSYNAIVSNQYSTEHTAQYQPDNSELLLYVHGWNMEEWEKKRWIETIFKRLWWQGYKGKTALFSWPTLSGFTGDLSSITDLMNFDNSEYRAWLSAAAAKNLIKQLNTHYNLTVYAHSMGNIVAGEAIRQINGMTKPKFIATQAAHSAQYYNSSIKDSISGKARLKIFFIKDLNITINGRIKTPDVFGFYYSGKEPSKPYFTNNFAKLSSFINLYNEFDYALDSWDYNNIYKPDFHWIDLFSYEGSDNSYNEPFDKCRRNGSNPTIYTFGSSDDAQRYAIFSYIMQSHSRALGTVHLPEANNTNLNLIKNDLGDVLFDDTHYGHSRQFRSFCAETYQYWQLIIPQSQSSQPNIQSQMF